MPALGFAKCRQPSSGVVGPVLSLDVVDAYSPRVPPLITVFADGRLAVRAPPPSSQVLAGQIPRAQLEDLWKQIVLRDRIPEIDSATLREGLAQGSGNLGNPMADAPMSFLTVSAEGCNHSVQVKGSAMASMRADYDEIHRFRRAEVLLLDLATALQLSQRP